MAPMGVLLPPPPEPLSEVAAEVSLVVEAEALEPPESEALAESEAEAESECVAAHAGS